MPHKICKKCQTPNGVRSLACKNCKTLFVNIDEKVLEKKEKPKTVKTVRKKRIKREKIDKYLKVEDWRTIQPDDIIQVKNGPYSLVNGEPHDMGYNGHFRVLYLDDNGIHAYAHPDSDGHSYIWMGPEMTTSNGIIRRAHTIRKFNKDSVKVRP